MGDIIVIVVLCTALVWIGRIFYALQKGLNEIITGLNSIDERLARLESGTSGVNPTQGPDPTS